MAVLDALTQRNSHPQLVGPGPDAAALQTIVAAGLRAPDHGRLRPWQFVVIEGDRRTALGDLFVKSLRLNNPEASEAEVAKARNAPLRAPVILAGLLRAKDHPKIPRVEQVATVACALHGMQLAADSLGFGSMWRTGGYARDPLVVIGLGGQPQDEVIGFLYLGTREGPQKPLCVEAVDDYLSYF